MNWGLIIAMAVSLGLMASVPLLIYKLDQRWRKNRPEE